MFEEENQKVILECVDMSKHYLIIAAQEEARLGHGEAIDYVIKAVAQTNIAIRTLLTITEEMNDGLEWCERRLEPSVGEQLEEVEEANKIWGDKLVDGIKYYSAPDQEPTSKRANHAYKHDIYINHMCSGIDEVIIDGEPYEKVDKTRK